MLNSLSERKTKTVIKTTVALSLMGICCILAQPAHAAQTISGTVSYIPYEYGYPLNSVTIELHQGGTTETYNVALTGTDSPKSYSFTTSMTGTCDIVIPQNNHTGWFGDNSNTAVTLSSQTTVDFNLTHAVPGDADMDGACDDPDVDYFSAYYPTYGGATWDTADFNGDGNVDDFEVDVMSAYYDP